MTDTVAVDPTALDQLNNDLLDALAAVQRARRHLEDATGAPALPVPHPGTSTLLATKRPMDEHGKPAVRYRLRGDALQVIEARLARKRAGRG